jgi:hypothetical protein
MFRSELVRWDIRTDGQTWLSLFVCMNSELYHYWNTLFVKLIWVIPKFSCSVSISGCSTPEIELRYFQNLSYVIPRIVLFCYWSWVALFPKSELCYSTTEIELRYFQTLSYIIPRIVLFCYWSWVALFPKSELCYS